jgi:putative acetyltransferase
MQAVSLRRRTGADTTSLVDLWVASWREAMPNIDFVARRQWFCARLQTLEAAGAVTICGFDSGGLLLGFVTLDPASGQLDQFAVAPRAKGLGAADRLLEEARRLSPQGLVLEVNQENLRALNFYKRQGFEKIAAGVNPRSGLKTWRLRWSETS